MVFEVASDEILFSDFCGCMVGLFEDSPTCIYPVLLLCSGLGLFSLETSCRQASIAVDAVIWQLGSALGPLSILSLL